MAVRLVAVSGAASPVAASIAPAETKREDMFVRRGNQGGGVWWLGSVVSEDGCGDVEVDGGFEFEGFEFEVEDDAGQDRTRPLLACSAPLSLDRVCVKSEMRRAYRCGS